MAEQKDPRLFGPQTYLDHPHSSRNDPENNPKTGRTFSGRGHIQEGRKGGDMVWRQRDLRDYPWEGGTLWAQRLHARHEGPSLGRQGSTADSEALTGKQIYPVFVEMIINCLK